MSRLKMRSNLDSHVYTGLYTTEYRSVHMPMYIPTDMSMPRVDCTCVLNRWFVNECKRFFATNGRGGGDAVLATAIGHRQLRGHL